jgi:hypothetical protein
MLLLPLQLMSMHNPPSMQSHRPAQRFVHNVTQTHGLWVLAAAAEMAALQEVVLPAEKLS